MKFSSLFRSIKGVNNLLPGLSKAYLLTNICSPVRIKSSLEGISAGQKSQAFKFCLFENHFLYIIHSKIRNIYTISTQECVERMDNPVSLLKVSLQGISLFSSISDLCFHLPVWHVVLVFCPMIVFERND